VSRRSDAHGCERFGCRRFLARLPSVAVFPSLCSRYASVVSGQARLPRHVFALVVRMMGSLATAR